MSHGGTEEGPVRQTLGARRSDRSGDRPLCNFDGSSIFQRNAPFCGGWIGSIRTGVMIPIVLCRYPLWQAVGPRRVWLICTSKVTNGQSSKSERKVAVCMLCAYTGDWAGIETCRREKAEKTTFLVFKSLWIPPFCVLLTRHFWHNSGLLKFSHRRSRFSATLAASHRCTAPCFASLHG